MLCQVEVVITFKKEIKDPEGDTIHKHLLLRRGYDNIKNVRAGKYLIFNVDVTNCSEALELIKTACEKLRLYNPTIHDVEVRIRG